ncbi:MAG: cytochrome c [Deltaproteobacteria bacterium]|nr:cytochrome c [Deltaproteobacteria bacterium]
MRILLFLSVFLASVNVYAQAPSADPAAGKAKYDMFCATCHGPTGVGDGAASAALNPKPRNFQDPMVMGKKTDADLKKVVKEGGAAAGLSSTMPAWGMAMTDADIDNVIAYIRTLGKK